MAVHVICFKVEPLHAKKKNNTGAHHCSIVDWLGRPARLHEPAHRPVSECRYVAGWLPHPRVCTVRPMSLHGWPVVVRDLR